MIYMFKALSDILTGNKKRITSEHQVFLDTYKEIVNTVSVETVEAFGRLSVNVVHEGTQKSWAIELTPTDQMWWTENIKQGVRFKEHAGKVLLDMLEHLTEKVKVLELNEQEHQLLLDAMNR